MMLHKRLYNHVPPDVESRRDGNPTLLVSWWCTTFALAAILVRVGGRYVRTETLFKEDKVMFLSIIPLLIRMALVHAVLILGTNNVKTDGLTHLDINHRVSGSRLVLASRIFYASFIWTAKFTVLEFLKRIVGSHWTRTYELGLRYIRYFLLATFCIVFISTLAECQPFDHYWQVVPDPGPKCRQGLVQLLAMGACDILTDVILVIFPIPVVLASSMHGKRKVSLTLLFMLSLGLVAITAYRVPAVVSRHGSQNFRTLLASIEILAAAGVSNAIVIGSFIRDRGVKKAKYKLGSTGGSTLDRQVTRRTNPHLTLHHWGSDADLASDVGLTLQPELQSRKESVPRPAPIATPTVPNRRRSSLRPPPLGLLRARRPSGKSETSDSEDDDIKYTTDEEAVSPGTRHTGDTFSDTIDTPRKMSFFDVGGLLEQSSSPRTSVSQSTFNAWDFGADAGTSVRRSSNADSTSSNIAPHTQPSSMTSPRRSSRHMPGTSDRISQLSSHREEADTDLIDIELDSIPSTPRTNTMANRGSGPNNSLPAALAANPPGYSGYAHGNADNNTNNHRFSSRFAAITPSSSFPFQSRFSTLSDDIDGLEIVDAGGLLR